ncbi:hypothetical protein MMPV_002308 [Pyropia vietnamensis]
MLLLPLTVVHAVGSALAGVHVPGHHRHNFSGGRGGGSGGGDAPLRRASIDSGRPRRPTADARPRRPSVDDMRRRRLPPPPASRPRRSSLDKPPPHMLVAAVTASEASGASDRHPRRGTVNPPPHRPTGRRSSVDGRPAAVAAVGTGNGDYGHAPARRAVDSYSEGGGDSLPSSRISLDRMPTKTEIRAWAGGSAGRARRASIEVGGVAAGRTRAAVAVATAADSPLGRRTRGTQAAAAVTRKGRLAA